MTRASARQLADRMVELGMLSPTKSAEVLAWINKWGEGDASEHDPLELSDLLSYLPEFGVAVSIHAEDVDFVDDYYRSVFESEIFEVTGGAVVVTDVTLLETEDGDEYLYFVRDGEPVWWTMDHQSEDYVDMLTVVENFGDFDPGGDDPRSFHLHQPESVEAGQDQIFVFATREQALALRDEFGIDFLGLDSTPREHSRAEAAEFLAHWRSGMDERLRAWREEFLPKGFPFDFTPGSLDTLERLVHNRFDGPGAFDAERSGGFVTGAVAYVGETLIRAESGDWEYRVDVGLYDREPVVRSGQPPTFSSLASPTSLLGRIAAKREFGVLARAVADFRNAAANYDRALRALESGAAGDFDEED